MLSKNEKLYYFNPGHENAILNASPYYTAPANIVKMQHDLQCLPIWYASHKDYVYSENHLPSDFHEFIKRNIQPVATIKTKKELDVSSIYSIHLWGISPQAIHVFQELNHSTASQMQLPIWNKYLLDLNSRKTAKECLSLLIKDIPDISVLILPHFLTELQNIEEIVSQTEYQLLAKAPFSSSGRGLLWLPIGGVTRTERQILHGILKKQGSVSIEKVLDKKIDFAMEFTIDSETKVIFEGYSVFETNNKGAYMGNYLGSQSNIESLLTSYIEPYLLDQIKQWLLEYLKVHFSPYYQGCVGIDMMIYFENGYHKLHPCVEINVRDNMGLLALRISQNYLAENTTGRFYIDFSSKENDIYNKHLQMQKEYPLAISQKKFQHGYFSLCPVSSDSKYRAYILLD